MQKHMKDDIAPSEKLAKKLPVLRNHVLQALQDYFVHLDGQAPVNLYELVITELEVPMLEMALNYVGGNQSKAAQILGLSRGTLRKKLERYKLTHKTKRR